MNCIKIWDYNINIDLISNTDYKYLKNFENKPIFSLNEMWLEMDKIWDSLHLNNRKSFRLQNIGDYYSHPVWILNGLFSIRDKESSNHRLLIASYIKNLDKNKNICDFGGGFGELAIKISQHNPNSMVTILEPFISKIGLSRVNSINNINIKSCFDTKYDIIIAQDVLEHIENPINLTKTLINNLNKDGYLIFANCFHPFIKAHLPGNFHLSRTFKWIMKSSGLSFIQNIPDAPHIEVYKKDRKYYKLLVILKLYLSIIFHKLKNI